jgi:E3 ubiquitin-protein ligase RFWD2
MGLWRGAGLVASGSESNHVFVYDLRWAKPVWVHPFGLADSDAGGGFVSAVAWRQGDADAGGSGALVAGRSDGVLKMFTCQRRTHNPQVAREATLPVSSELSQ